MPSRIIPKDYFFIWLALVLMGLWFRPLIPVDETRAVSVAWEMWQRGDFLVPHLNGLPYSHKPPLLQWCIHLSWWLFGVSEWAARLVGPLFALGNLVLTAKLARRLWPDDPLCERLAPLLLLGLPVWALWSSMTLYDMLVTFFTLAGLCGILRAAQGQPRIGWMLAGLAIGGGVLAKGPVILLLILPPALFAPWWRRTADWRWYAGLLGAVLLGAALALAWAVPAGLAGGEEYRRAIFWGQSAGRISQSFAHQRPFWWYFALLPLLCLPWTFWPPLWRSVKSKSGDLGLRFCGVQILSVLAVFSCISGKQIHYLLPIFPAISLAAARALSLSRLELSRLDQTPIGGLLALFGLAFLLLPWLGLEVTKYESEEIAAHTPFAAKLLLLALGPLLLIIRPSSPLAGARLVALSMTGLLLTAHLIFRQVGWPYYSMQPFADRLATVQNQGAPVVHWLDYHGDFNFLGRLLQPINEIDDQQQLLAWMQTHPAGYVALLRQPFPAISEDGAEFAQFYRGSRRMMLWQAQALLDRPGIFEQIVVGKRRAQAE